VRLQDKVCVITGAAGAIGRETAALFSAEGGTVVAVDLMPGSGGDLSLVVDVADEQQVEAMYNEVSRRFGRIDVLFNNAGIAPPEDCSVLETPFEVWEHVIRVNLTSVYLCCKHGIPHLLRRPRTDDRSVINTASLVAVVGSAVSQVAYTASKGGVLALSRELGIEFAKHGVRVNALCPGPVETPLLRNMFSHEDSARRLVHVPVGRFARAAEIASAACFLASDESSYVNASTFLVDGGITAAYVTAEDPA